MGNDTNAQFFMTNELANRWSPYFMVQRRLFCCFDRAFFVWYGLIILLVHPFEQLDGVAENIIRDFINFYCWFIKANCLVNA